MNPELYFVIPGDLQTLTGGYAYDRALIEALETAGVKVHHVPLSAQFPRPDADALAEAARCLAAIPDQSLVLIDGLAYGVMDVLAGAEHQRLRIIALCHHPLALESGLDPDTQARLLKSERAALRLAMAVIVTSAATARLLVSRFGIANDRITVALPGTRKNSFAPCRGDPPYLLTVATLTQRKGHDVLIAALSRITELSWRARFVGGDQFDPGWASMLRKQVSTQNLDDRIHFTGSIEDLGTEYASADVFVLPSRFEGYGMVYAEALSFGLPIVATRAGAVPDVVPASAGVLVPTDNADALAEALHGLLSNPSQRRKLQQGARRAAAGLPDWHDAATRVMQVMHTVRNQH